MKSEGKIIGIISIKGGVGKTTTVLNLATALAQDFKKKVLVVDANFSSPNISLHLGMLHHDANLHAVLNDELLIHDSIYEHEFGFDVLPCSLSNEKVNTLKLKNKISVLKKHYDIILLDSSPSLNDELLATMLASDQLFVVSSPDYPTLSTTLRAVKLAKEKGTPILGIIMNNVHGKKHELSLDQIETLTKVPVLAVLPDDQKVLEALASVKPITLHKPYNKISLEYKRLAAAIADLPFKEPSLAKKAFNYLKEDFENFKKHDFKKGLIYYK